MPDPRPRAPHLLFWGPTLIWASTWHVILVQLDSPVAVPVAVGWRFGLAALLLCALARWRGDALAVPLRWQPWLLLTGLVQYGGNYWSIYEAERFVPSGLVAVLYALIVFGSAATGAWFFGHRVTRGFLAAAVAGVLGVALIFWPEIAASAGRPQAGRGLLFGLTGVGCACVGNTLTLKLRQQGIALVPLLAWCMGYGALGLMAAGAAGGASLAPGAAPAWWLSLLYLSGAGSVAAFLMYFQLALIEGPGRAAFTGVITPVIALAVSAALEGWRPTPLALAGMALCVGSVAVAIRRGSGG